MNERAGHFPTRRAPGTPCPTSPETTPCCAGRGYSAQVQDAAYKKLFSHPRMVEDLLRGFAAATWSEKLDLGTLEKLPAEFVSGDLRRRQGDALWRVRFRDARWLYVLVLLEFQSTVDRYMAVRMLVYTGLLYQDLIRRGAPGPVGKLPPVLPVVLYNGRSPWTAADDVAKLTAPTDEPLACYQPSQRYFLLDGRTRGNHDLPRGNLVSALLRFEKSRSPDDLERAVKSLPGWLGQPEESELKRAFMQWAAQMAMPARYRPEDLSLILAQLEEDPTMLAENAREWYEEAHRRGIEEGRAEERALLRRLAARKFSAKTAERLAGMLEEITAPGELGEEDPTMLAENAREWYEEAHRRGIEEGRAEERALLRRLAARKFSAKTAERLAGMLEEITAPGELGEVGDWIIECDTDAELLERTGRLLRSAS